MLTVNDLFEACSGAVLSVQARCTPAVLCIFAASAGLLGNYAQWIYAQNCRLCFLYDSQEFQFCRGVIKQNISLIGNQQKEQIIKMIQILAESCFFCAAHTQVWALLGFTGTFTGLGSGLKQSLQGRAMPGVNSSVSLLEPACEISLEGQGLNFSVH